MGIQISDSTIESFTREIRYETVSGDFEINPMAADELAKNAQRMICEQYPLTRVLWQDFREPDPPGTRSTPVANRSVFLNRTTTPGGPRPSPDSRYLPGLVTRRPTYTRSVANGRPTRRTFRDGEEQLDRVVSRVIDFRFPETRRIWMNSRSDPSYLETRSAIFDSIPPQTAPTLLIGKS
jgi:hypothetical protein